MTVYRFGYWYSYPAYELCLLNLFAFGNQARICGNQWPWSLFHFQIPAFNPTWCFFYYSGPSLPWSEFWGHELNKPWPGCSLFWLQCISLGTQYVVLYSTTVIHLHLEVIISCLDNWKILLNCLYDTSQIHYLYYCQINYPKNILSLWYLL